MSLSRVAALVAGLVVGLAGLSAQAAPALWKVTSPTSEIYLFGTLHALKPGTAWRTSAYDAAYARAQTVWFEADLGNADAATVGMIVSRYGVDPERGLSEKLAAADLAALQGEADMGRLEHLRPWAAALMLSMRPVLARGADVARGADITVTREARAGGKQIRAFETLEEQAQMFAGLSEPAEVRYLSDVIRERQEHDRHVGPPRLSFDPRASSLEAEWLAGDLVRLGPALVGELARGNAALYDALLKRRNLAWADRLAGELAGGQVELVNVGALHMVGPDGLPALLAARGFKVQRVQ